VPSARLPFSIPVDEDDLPPFDRDATSFRYDRWHGWWHLRRTGRAPAFPFGFGLSYTTFALDDVAVIRAGEQVVASGVVHNTGARDGAEVVQVYAELPLDDRPDRLVGFTRVEVPAGGTADFMVEVPLERLATRDPDSRTWRPPQGPHTFTVGWHADDPGHPTTIDLTSRR
jgi:beta-glucosidase